MASTVPYNRHRTARELEIQQISESDLLPKKFRSCTKPSFLPAPKGISKSFMLPPPEKARMWQALCCLEAVSKGSKMGGREEREGWREKTKR
jgi:hypothetical protein